MIALMIVLGVCVAMWALILVVPPLPEAQEWPLVLPDTDVTKQ